MTVGTLVQVPELLVLRTVVRVATHCWEGGGWDGLEISDLLELCAEARDHQIIYAAQGSRGITLSELRADMIITRQVRETRVQNLQARNCRNVKENLPIHTPL